MKFQELYRYQVPRVVAEDAGHEDQQGDVWHGGAGPVAEVLCAVAILLTLLLPVLVSVAGLEIWLLSRAATTSHLPTCSRTPDSSRTIYQFPKEACLLMESTGRP